MKQFSILTSLLLSISFANSYGQAPSSKNLVIRSLLNSSPAEVSEKLGKPDKPLEASKDCDYLPYRKVGNYQNDKYEVMFFNNKLKWIQVNKDGIFNNSAIQFAGFPACTPTLSNNFGIWWRNAATRGTTTGPLIPIKGLRGICVFPSNSANQYKGYMLVMVERSYNQKFL